MDQGMVARLSSNITIGVSMGTEKFGSSGGGIVTDFVVQVGSTVSVNPQGKTAEFLETLFAVIFMLCLFFAGTATADENLAGSAKCLECHDEQSDTPVWSIFHTTHGVSGDSRSPMGALGCESCHGASAKHASQPRKVAPGIGFGPKWVSEASERSAICLDCHRDSTLSYWHSSTHEQEEIACNDCHQSHLKKDPVLDRRLQADQCFDCHKIQQAKLNLPSTHPIAQGKTVCSDCHNPHGGTSTADLVGVSLIETCLGCHKEKRGPFLFEHPPAAEDCGECHKPHGSAHPSLLVARPPFLCQRCHMSAFHPSTLNDGSGLASANPNNRLLGKSCLNCHRSVHGSNHPSGARLTR